MRMDASRGLNELAAMCGAMAATGTIMTAWKEIYSEVVPAFAAVGLKKRSEGIFIVDLRPDIRGMVSLSAATKHRRRGEVGVNPNVGVRFQEVERLVAECLGSKFQRYGVATITVPLGYLMPEKWYRTWDFVPGNYDEVAENMAQAVAAYGLPFMRSVVGFPELIEKMDARLGHDHQLAWAKPVAWFLLGDVARATAELDASVAALGQRTDGAADNHRRFAEALRQRMFS